MGDVEALTAVVGTDKMFVRERDFIILMGVDVLVCIRLISESSSSSTLSSSYSLWQLCIVNDVFAVVVVVSVVICIDFREEFLTGLLCCCLCAFFVLMGARVLRRVGTAVDDVVDDVVGVTTISFSSLNCVRGATVDHLVFEEELEFLYEPAVNLRSCGAKCSAIE